MISSKFPQMNYHCEYSASMPGIKKDSCLLLSKYRNQSFINININELNNNYKMLLSIAKLYR